MESTSTVDSSKLPPREAFWHAILKYLADKPDGDTRENVHAAMPLLLHLTEEQRSERLKNLPHLRYRYRSGWGLSILKACGYLDSPARGVWRATNRGRELLVRHPDGFSEEIRRQITREYRKRDPGVEDAVEKSEEVTSQPDEQTPDEQIDGALKEIHRVVQAELLERILAMSPESFEQLVLDLLHRLGYGASERDLQRVGGAGDGGFDGIISLDRLGLEKVYVQAKRWQGTVGRPEVQAFYGALSGRRARKGVFITTSRFTREAQEFGGQIGESVVLIDGIWLTSLMLEHGIAVIHRVVRLPRIDRDYFEAE